LTGLTFSVRWQRLLIGDFFLGGIYPIFRTFSDDFWHGSCISKNRAKSYNALKREKLNDFNDVSDFAGFYAPISKNRARLRNY